jgi:hypothetical protein
VEVSFEPGSKLARIGKLAFVNCGSLRSFVIPAQLEILARGVFGNCQSLCELIFEIPSHLKQLDLPPSEFGTLCIPDSVKFVCALVGIRPGQKRLLQFGPESSWMTIDLRHVGHFWAPAGSNSFVRLSEKVLRRFRCQFECL